MSFGPIITLKISNSQNTCRIVGGWLLIKYFSENCPCNKDNAKLVRMLLNATGMKGYNFIGVSKFGKNQQSKAQEMHIFVYFHLKK